MLARIHRRCSGGGPHGAAAVLPIQAGARLGYATPAARSGSDGATSTWMASTARYAVAGIPCASTAARLPSAAGASGVSAPGRIRTAAGCARWVSHRPDRRRRSLRSDCRFRAGHDGGMGTASEQRPFGAGHNHVAVPLDHSSQYRRVGLIVDEAHHGTGAPAASWPQAGIRARQQSAISESGRGIHECAVLHEHMAVRHPARRRVLPRPSRVHGSGVAAAA